eukprot:gene10418-biopygen21312
MMVPWLDCRSTHPTVARPGVHHSTSERSERGECFTRTPPTPPHPEARPVARPVARPEARPVARPGARPGARPWRVPWRGPASITRRASGASEESAL